MIQLPLLGLVAFSVLLLADDFGRASVWTTRLGSAQTQCARVRTFGAWTYPGRHDDDELEVVADLVRASHSLATGSVV